MTTDDQIRQSTDPEWVKRQIGVAPKAVLYVTWMMENGSGRIGPFDSNDDAAREAQTVLRSHRFGTVVVTISPHLDGQ